MAGIKPQEKKKNEKLNVGIDPDVLQDAKAYAKFLDGSELGYTVQELLRAQMARDAKFQKFLVDSRPAPATAPLKLESKKGAAA